MEVRIFDPCITPEMIGYRTDGACGIDLYACLKGRISIFPGETYRIPTGVGFWIRDVNLAGFVSLRSGFKSNLIMPNSDGKIDSDYQGEIQVKLINVGHEPVLIEPYERFAQLTIVPVHIVDVFEIVDQFSEVTARNERGFGSTGSR